MLALISLSIRKLDSNEKKRVKEGRRISISCQRTHARIFYQNLFKTIICFLFELQSHFQMEIPCIRTKKHYDVITSGRSFCTNWMHLIIPSNPLSHHAWWWSLTLLCIWSESHSSSEKSEKVEELVHLDYLNWNELWCCVGWISLIHSLDYLQPSLFQTCVRWSLMRRSSDSPYWVRVFFIGRRTDGKFSNFNFNSSFFSCLWCQNFQV